MCCVVTSPSCLCRVGLSGIILLEGKARPGRDVLNPPNFLIWRAEFCAVVFDTL